MGGAVIETPLQMLLNQIGQETAIVLKQRFGVEYAVVLAVYGNKRVDYSTNVKNKDGVAQIAEFIAADARKVIASPVVPEALHKALN